MAVSVFITAGGEAVMDTPFDEAVYRFRTALYGQDLRDALTDCLMILSESLNVTPPNNCPNCGAAVSGKSTNCEYCGTLLIWKKV